ncbi:hypothetical protein VNO78_28889 [Psophocarpus tetragonolobus]|uniref:Uncharacterized protein n=1 Tax=Psophocarpus tetragonolobus TaxID=3891 RepID=A0AAN9RUH7_PSOTE
MYSTNQNKQKSRGTKLTLIDYYSKRVKDMGGMKRWFFKSLRNESWRKMKLFRSSFKWKKLYWPLCFVDYLMFKIMSAFDTVVLVFMLSFFYLCCGCTF